ncbi:hypothetical protein ACPV5S_15495 [Vibrio astriarenae]
MPCCGSFRNLPLDGRLSVYNAINRARGETLKEKKINNSIVGFKLYRCNKPTEMVARNEMTQLIRVIIPQPAKEKSHGSKRVS